MALKTALRKLYVAEEATFGTEPDADGSDYKYLHGETSLPKVANEVLKYPAQNDNLDPSAHIVGAQKASFDLKLPIRANGTPSAPPSTPAAAPEVDLLLTHVLGAAVRGQSTAVNAGNASTTNIVVTASAGFQIGMIVQVSANSTYHYVSAIPDGTHVTIAPATSPAPTTGNIVAANFYAPANTGQKTLAFAMFIDTIEWTFLGCRATAAKLSGLGANAVPMLEMSFEADSYSATTKASLAAPNDLFAAVKPPILKGSPFWEDGVKTVVAGIEFDLGVKSAYLSATEGAQGRAGYEVTEREAKGSIMPYYASSYLTAFQAGTDKVLAIQWGTTTTGGGLWIPKARYLEPEYDDRSGVLGQKVPFGCYDNGTSPAFALSIF